MTATRIATWNIQWCTPRSHSAPAVRQLLTNLDADVQIITEGCAEMRIQ